MQYSKRYPKSENWFSQMRWKLVEEIVRNIKKKSSIDACEVELWRFKFMNSEIPSFEKMSWKVVAAKNFVKN